MLEGSLGCIKVIQTLRQSGFADPVSTSCQRLLPHPRQHSPRAGKAAHTGGAGQGTAIPTLS